MTQPGDKGAPTAPGVPPVGEEVHLPGPTLIPVVSAAGTTLALVGLVIHPVLLVVGVVTVVWSTVRWIRDTRRDIADLPLDHHG